MDFVTWSAFVATSLVLLAVPGPNAALVVACSLAHGRRAAVPLAAGIMAADLVMMAAAVAGAGAVLAAAPSLHLALQVAGAAYMGWLGVGIWRSAPVAAGPGPTALRGGGVALARRACLASLLNPLTAGFFAAYLPQFIDPARPLAGQGLVLAATFLALVAVNVLTLAVLASGLGAWAGRAGAGAWGRRLGGAALVAVGAALLAAAL